MVISCPARPVPSQNWCPLIVMFPEVGTTRVTSTASPIGGATTGAGGGGSGAGRAGTMSAGGDQRRRQLQRQAISGVRVKPVGREGHADALMRPVGVVVTAEGVDRGLGVGHRRERRLLVQ